MNFERITKFSDTWAYDLDKELTRGEITDVDVINQSIEAILSTLPGERLFNPQFGSNFQLRIFDTMDEDFLETLIDDTVGALQRWESRITIIEEDFRINIFTDSNSVDIFIPYIINERRLKAAFERKISQ
tara:strand:+ start:1745 stop:2134 length:390 start_codon:yes stop_codon:yes gene_type:complete